MIKNNKFKKYVAIWLLASIILSFISPSEVKANSLSAKIINITGNDVGYKDIGYTMATVAISTNGTLYKYWLNNKDTDEWKLLRDYSELSSYTWKPEKTGNYRLVVHVKDKNSTKKYDDYGYRDIIVKGNENITELKYQGIINKKMKYQNEIWAEYPNSNYGNYPETMQYEKDGFKGTLYAKRIKLVPAEEPKNKWVKGRTKNNYPEDGKRWMKVTNGGVAKIKAGYGFEVKVVTNYKTNRHEVPLPKEKQSGFIKERVKSGMNLNIFKFIPDFFIIF